MTQQRRDARDRDRDRNRPAPDAGPGRQADPNRDAGAYIGRKPERATETIPGGVGPKDVRVSAVGTQPGPVRGDTNADAGAMPEGHREGQPATDDVVREAGQNR